MLISYWAAVNSRHCFLLFLVWQNEDEDGAAGGRAKPTLVSIPNPLYSGSRAFAEPFGVSWLIWIFISSVSWTGSLYCSDNFSSQFKAVSAVASHLFSPVKVCGEHKVISAVSELFVKKKVHCVRPVYSHNRSVSVALTAQTHDSTKPLIPD